MIYPKDVYRIFDRTTRPPKPKRVICVCPDSRLFLRLNSQPIWRPHHILMGVSCDFLERDSYVELKTLYRYLDDDIREATKLGRLSHPVALGIMQAVESAATINQRHKDLVRERWGY